MVDPSLVFRMVITRVYICGLSGLHKHGETTLCTCIIDDVGLRLLSVPASDNSCESATLVSIDDSDGAWIYSSTLEMGSAEDSSNVRYCTESAVLVVDATSRPS